MYIVEKNQLRGGEKMPTMDYSKLLGRIKEKGYTQKALARLVGISEGQFSQKISGNYAFKQAEIQKICDLLKIDADEIGVYFFTPRVEKTQSEESA